MAKKTYKIILLGKIAERYDVEITHEKLAIVFDIDLKKIPKLLKKPTVIRKNLTETYASKYKHGLEKIGVPCQIVDPDGNVIGTQVEPVSKDEDSNVIGTQTDPVSKDEDSNVIGTQAEPVSKDEDDATEMFSLVEKKDNTLILDGDTLRIINIKMPFWSMVIFICKWILASIPALIILGGIGYYLIQLAVSSFPMEQVSSFFIGQ